jgi:mycofactocin system glycosyltransferase
VDTPAAGPGPGALPAPAGLRLRPDPGLRTYADGTVLAGGSPLRLMRLGPRGARQVRAWWDGAPVPAERAAGSLARRLLETGMAHPDPAGGPPGDDVTVVIPVRDRAPQLARCLAGLAGLKVIVVDDASADPRPVAAAAAAAGARYLRRDRNGGPAAARNTGLAAVSTPLAAFVDSDCVPRPGWLPPLLAHFSDPVVGAAAPRIVPAEQGSGWLARYEAVCASLDMGPVESIVRPGARVPYVPGAALVVRRAAAGDGFDEGMAVGEDVDFVWRLAAAGWQVRYEPGASVGHQHRVRPGEWLRRRRDYGTSAAPLELRHPGTVPALRMSGWSALAWLAAMLGRPAGAAAVTGVTTALLARRLAPLTPDPWPLAARLAGGGTLAAGQALGSALTRTWWPLAVPAALAVPRLRLPLAALALAPPLLDWRRRRPPLGPLAYTTAWLAGDLAYGAGVWQGCLAHRTARPLRPVLWWRSGASRGPGR